jgi:enamine deaminase RidA (YjgF/YER057c/UK114 family)
MVAPAGPTLSVGGQNGTDETGAVLDGLGPQTEQALRNVLAELEEAGTDADHVALLRIYLDPAVDPGAAPARAGALVAIEAVASIPGR